MKSVIEVISKNYIDGWAVFFLTLLSVPFLWSPWGIPVFIVGTFYVAARQKDADDAGAVLIMMSIFGFLTFVLTEAIAETNAALVNSHSTDITIKEITADGVAIITKTGNTVIYNISQKGAINHLNGKECSKFITDTYSWWDGRSEFTKTYLDCEKGE